MDSNRKMKTQKIPQCADEGKLLFSSEEAQRQQQVKICDGGSRDWTVKMHL